MLRFTQLVLFVCLKNSNVTLLLVGSADVTARAETLGANESQELYVEIKLDQKRVHATTAAERNDVTVIWNSKLLLYV